jgi:hypothetical protein
MSGWSLNPKSCSLSGTDTTHASFTPYHTTQQHHTTAPESGAPPGCAWQTATRSRPRQDSECDLTQCFSDACTVFHMRLPAVCPSDGFES